jgi:CheY-like chemotaxis protein
MNVLVDHDHAFPRRTLSRMLRGLGAPSVLVAEQGEAALQMRQQSDSNINLVICDRHMPRVDGMAFIRRVGQQHAGLPVMLTRAYDKSLISLAASMSRAYHVQLLGAIPKSPEPEARNARIKRYPWSAAGGTQPGEHRAKAYPLEEISQGVQNGEFEPFSRPKI